ncbi:reverse transcriptase domain-containing protein [Xanthobacter sp. 126]|uniref:reverse transcriptase domain-containing protein n=1 Tax=Xanthobacter sp. 126 TaxID=1131814 RepID=UPI0012DFC815|nr:reverse transcriptase domain-containing protein [Xanthobacter sp. 126]
MYRRLGIWGRKTVSGRTSPVEGYLVDPLKIPKRLCDSETMRQIVFGDSGKHERINEVRTEAYGIPQGTPISDLLANMYMLDFDREMKGLAEAKGGVYMRYSDDILFVIPADGIDAKAFVERISLSISDYGDTLRIADDKTSIHRFIPANKGQDCRNVDEARPSKRFEYLGFSYDGCKVRIRDSTLSGLVQKIAAVTRREAFAAARRYPTTSVAQICEQFNYSDLYCRFLRVRNFETVEDKSGWTFWTYVRKIEATMKVDGRPAIKQVRKLKEQIRRRFRLYVQKSRDIASAKALSTVVVQGR